MEPMTDTAAVAAFGALAQDTRLAIYRLLVETGAAGLPAGAIAEATGVPAPTLSFHLAQLRGAGLVSQRRESRSLIYAVDIDRMNGLIGFLSDRRSEEHTSELQSLMRISYAVFCLKKKKTRKS